MTTFNIRVHFDAVCAWFLVGQRSLDQAIALYQRTYLGGKDDKFKYIYHPFYLRTNSPKDGVPPRDAMEANHGEGKTERIFGRVAVIGRSYGINFSIDGKTGDTRLCHQMVYCAGQKYGSEVQKRLVECVYSINFEQGGNITSAEDLTKGSEEAGLGAEEVEIWFKDEETAAKVDEMAAQARAKGITGVPTFEINGIQISGAEDVNGIFEALIQAKFDSMGEEAQD
jgi:predicted DsbA family dithiol-disulfide isomerase